jgi:hypothetical protein
VQAGWHVLARQRLTLDSPGVVALTATTTEPALTAALRLSVVREGQRGTAAAPAPEPAAGAVLPAYALAAGTYAVVLSAVLSAALPAGSRWILSGRVAPGGKLEAVALPGRFAVDGTVAGAHRMVLNAVTLLTGSGLRCAARPRAVPLCAAVARRVCGGPARDGDAARAPGGRPAQDSRTRAG